MPELFHSSFATDADGFTGGSRSSATFIHTASAA